MKKRFTKRTIGVILAASLILSAFAGCQNGSTTSQPATASNAPTDSGASSQSPYMADKPVTLTYAIRENAGWPISEDTPVLKEMTKQTNVTIQYIILPADDPDAKFNTLLAGGTLPDLMSNTASVLTKYGGQGAFVDLAPYLDTELSNVKKLIDESTYAKAVLYTDFGKLFAIPRFHQNQNEFSWMIRKDWLDTLGLSLPETIDDWVTDLTAFKEKDPGNAGSNLIPMVIRGGISNLLSVAEPDFGMHWQVYTDKDGTGKFVMNATTDEYKTELQWFNQLYENKLLDNEVVTCDTSRWEEYMSNGYAGATIDYGVRTDVFSNALQKTNPDAELVAVAPPKGPNGDQGLPCYTDVLDSRSLAISKDCKDVDAACKWLNFLFSDEGAWLTGVGIDGVTYNGTDADGNPNWIDEIANDPNDYSVTSKYGIQQPDNARNMTQYEFDNIWGKYTLEAIKIDTPYWVQPYYPGGYTDDMTTEDTALSAATSPVIKEESAKFITGARSFDTFDDFVSSLKDLGSDRECELFSEAHATMEKKVAAVTSDSTSADSTSSAASTSSASK